MESSFDNPADHGRRALPTTQGQHPKLRRDLQEKPAQQLPEFLEAHEVDALAVSTRDLSLDTDRPTSSVQQGKGSIVRVVPVHSELHAALTSALQFGSIS